MTPPWGSPPSAISSKPVMPVGTLRVSAGVGSCSTRLVPSEVPRRATVRHARETLHLSRAGNGDSNRTDSGPSADEIEGRIATGRRDSARRPCWAPRRATCSQFCQLRSHEKSVVSTFIRHPGTSTRRAQAIGKVRGERHRRVQTLSSAALCAQTQQLVNRSIPWLDDVHSSIAAEGEGVRIRRKACGGAHSRAGYSPRSRRRRANPLTPASPTMARATA